MAAAVAGAAEATGRLKMMAAAVAGAAEATGVAMEVPAS